MLSKKIGAPSKLTPEIMNRIISVIEAGNYIEVACQSVGINIDTYYHWLERAREDIEEGLSETESSYITFSEAVKKAHAAAELALLSKVRDPNCKDWQRYSWILERTRQDRYAIRNKVDLSSKEPLKIVFESVKEAAD